MRVARTGRGLPFRWGALLLAGAALPACAPRDGGPAVAAERGALVQLDVAYTRDLTPGADARLEAAAHFIRYDAADPTVDRTVVASLLGLGDDATIALDTCRRDPEARSDATVGAAHGAGAVEVSLLDAGALQLRTRDGSDSLLLAQLEPQHYPELFPFVTGVIYGQETIPAPPIDAGGQLEIEAAGGEDVGPFLAASSIPAAFPDLRAARQRATGAVDLTWTPSSAEASVLINVRWAGERAGALRCRARDDGSFSIAPLLLTGLDAAVAAGAGAQVSVSRSERAPMEAPGAGAGTLTVTLRDSAPLDAAQP